MRPCLSPFPVFLTNDFLLQRNGRVALQQGFYRIGSQKFHPNGLEFLLAPSTHALKPEPEPSEGELWLFEESIHRGGDQHDINDLMQGAVRKAYYKKVQ